MKKLILSSFFIATCFHLHAQSWLTTGNSSTTPPTNYIGTNDAAALQFKVNKQPSGYIDYAAGKANTSFGFQSLKNITGSSNAAFGYKASFSNTTGKNNTSLGAYALYFNTSGYSNIAAGIGALYKNTVQSNLVAVGDSALYNNSGSINTAVGSKALYANTTGNSNSAFGFLALYNNTTGSYNTASGTNALISNTTGNYNTANGYQSLYFNSAGTQNTAIGYQALYRNTANLNTAVGYRALYTNSSGSFNIASGTFSMYNNSTGYSNTAYGYSSLYANTTGFYNTGIGTLALYSNNGGSYNTATGYHSLYSNTGSENTANGYFSLYNNLGGFANTATGYNALTTISSGSFNTAMGNCALCDVEVGNYNTSVGNFAGPALVTEIYNSTCLGDEAETDVDNHIRIGNSSVNSIGGQVSWSNFSDERIKKDVKENVPGLAFIKLLKPVTYHFSLAKEAELAGKKKDTANWRSKYDIEKINFTGLLAQEVDKAARKINYDFSGVDKDGKIWALRYAEFVMPLIKSVQELSRMNDDKDSVIAAQNLKIDDLTNRLAKIEAAINLSSSATVSNLQVTGLSTASLAQNIPNPFNNATTIRYTLPQTYSSARIVVTDKTGYTVKEINLSGNTGSIHIDASVLSSGAYSYSLYVDGRLIAARQMVLAK